MTEKEELIEALKKERQRFIDLGHNVEDHDFAIDYLEKGGFKADLAEYELLEACVNSFDDVYNTYCNEE